MTDSAGAAPPTKSGTPTQNWDASLTGTARFTTAFPGAVLDNNTGLVWEQAPDANLATTRDWPTAISYCVNKNVGGTVGWRLPSVVELRSVQNGSPCCGPYVPASIFTGVGVQADHYWSATTVAADPSRAWVILFGGGEGASPFTLKLGAATVGTWCVRGPMNADAY
jgi:hypothetical protein